MPLMQAISKTSYRYAKFLQDNGVPQMAFKGRVQVGAGADITIFDPRRVTDNSKLEQRKNGLPSTGSVYPGRPIRLPVH